VNFSTVPSEKVWFICMGDDYMEANICTVLVKGYSLGGSSQSVGK